MSAAVANQWIGFPRRRQAARVRLFCLPFAGSGAVTYRDWQSGMPEWTEVCPILLPGREMRLTQAPLRRMAALVEAIADAIALCSDLPFALFGHSLGALTAFELARELRRRGAPMPVRLIVSGRRAPALPRNDPLLHDKPDAALIERMRRLGGTPAVVLENPDLLALLLPALRADFEVLETWHYVAEQPLDTPIAAFGGRDDPTVPQADLDRWRDETAAGFSLRMLPGAHFFLQSERHALLDEIALLLAGHAAAVCA
jgi:medium-chain acyl-[acyl-carrier-protein] hydrolase